MKNIFKKIFLLSLSSLVIFGIFTSPLVVYGAVTNKIPTPIALYEDSLANAITSSTTSFTLVRGTDIVGTSLATSTYGFIIDEGSASQEFVLADCTATVCTNALRGVSPITGLTEVTSLKKTHRRGAVVKMTDAPILLILKRLLDGNETLPNIISYASHPTFTSDTQVIDKKYADDLAIAGSPDSTTTVKGIGKVSVAPVSSTSPIFVGDNDPRVPTQNENDALVGTSGTSVSSSNKLVDNADTSSTASGSKVIRWSSGAYPAGDGSLLTNISTQNISQSYTLGETISAGMPVYLKASDGKIYKASASTVNEAFYNYIGILATSGVLNDSRPVYTEPQVVTGLSLGASTDTVAETTDFSQTSGTATMNVPIYSGGTTGGVVFATGKNVSNITKFDVRLIKNLSGSGAVTATLQSATPSTSGFTYGSSLGTASVATPTDNSVNTFTFSSPITLSPNSWYIISFTGAAGNGSNYWSLQGNSAGGIGTDVAEYTETNTSSTSLNRIYIPYLVTYYTTKINWQIGDNVYLDDTAGTLNAIVTGTNPLIVGRILSSSSMVISKPTGNRLIGTSEIIPNINDSVNYNSLILTPKNTTRIVFLATSSSKSVKIDQSIYDPVLAESISQPATTTTLSTTLGINNGLRAYGYLSPSNTMTFGTIYFYR